MSLPDDFAIWTGDALNRLQELPGECVQTCVTSPPYWGLRDYGVDGQLGLEPTPGAYVENLVQVFREVRRVLRPDGTLWLNLGDSYATAASATNTTDPMAAGARDRTDMTPASGVSQPNRGGVPGLKPKDLVGVPWRVAFALQRDGWWLRSDIIWHKPNPMPESVTDRPTSSHEHIFLLAKAEQYFYDHEAVAEPCATDPSEGYPGRARATGRGTQGYSSARGRDRDNSGGFPPTVSSGNDERKHGGDVDRPCSDLGRSVPWEGAKRNKRDVWTVTTKPYPDAHFAVYPAELIDPCVRAGTSQRGQCVECGAPWQREIERKTVRERADEAGTWAERPSARSPELPEGQRHGDTVGLSSSNSHDTSTPTSPESKTVGWTPTCDCGAGTEPQVVLDPFAGAGTTGVVCTKLGRRFLGIELNPEYAEMARDRIMDTNPTLFRAAGGGSG